MRETLLKVVGDMYEENTNLVESSIQIVEERPVMVEKFRISRCRKRHKCCFPELPCHGDTSSHRCPRKWKTYI
jgi:hypothetical protein